MASDRSKLSEALLQIHSNCLSAARGQLSPDQLNEILEYQRPTVFQLAQALRESKGERAVKRQISSTYKWVNTHYFYDYGGRDGINFYLETMKSMTGLNS
jgi:transglutaminase-like putative cysteine protease